MPIINKKRLIAEKLSKGISDLQGLQVPKILDGNTHSYYKFPIILSGKAVKKRSLIKKALELNGTITGEHGVGLHKKEYLLEQHPDNIPVMKSIKRTMDPNNIMNPGKIFDLN